MGPPGPFGVLPKSISPRVSCSDPQRKIDGIDLEQVLAKCLGDVEARRRGMSNRVKLWFLLGGVPPARNPLASTSSTLSTMCGREDNLLRGPTGFEARSAQYSAFEGAQ